MVFFLSRMGYSKLKTLINHSMRHYSQVLCSSSTNYITGFSSGIRVLDNLHAYKYQRRGDLYGVVRFFAAPVQAKPKPESKEQKGCRLNEQITTQFIRLVSDDGHSVVSKNEALERAKRLDLDLVEINRTAKPPVCKIMDYHREKYKQEIKEKERVKSKPEGTLRKGDSKEVRFSGKCEQKDLQIKANTVKRLMEKGYRVKCMAMGAEAEDLGRLLSRLSTLIEDVAFIESGPRVEKKQAYVIVRHVKFGLPKKSGKKAVKVAEPAKIEMQQAAINNSGSIQSPLQSEHELKDTASESEEDLANQAEDEAAWSSVDASNDFEKVFGLDDNCRTEVIPSSANRQLESASDGQLDYQSNTVNYVENFASGAVPNTRPVVGSTKAKLPVTQGSAEMTSADNTNKVSYSVPRNDTNRGPSATTIAHTGYQSQNQGSHPQKDVSSLLSREQPVRTDPFSFTNFKQPSSNETPKKVQSCPQTSSSQQPGYGIFSAPKHAGPSKQVEREAGIGSGRNPFDSSRRPTASNSTLNVYPPDARVDSHRPEREAGSDNGRSLFDSSRRPIVSNATLNLYPPKPKVDCQRPETEARFDSLRMPSAHDATLNAYPPKPNVDGRRPESENSGERKYGIFSR